MWCARRLSFGCSAVPRAAGYLLLRRGCAHALVQARWSRLLGGNHKLQLTRTVRLPRAIKAARGMPLVFAWLVSLQAASDVGPVVAEATDPPNSQLDRIPPGTHTLSSASASHSAGPTQKQASPPAPPAAPLRRALGARLPSRLFARRRRRRRRGQPHRGRGSLSRTREPCPKPARRPWRASRTATTC